MALIEIPRSWAGHAPVFPGASSSQVGGWERAAGLAEDVRRYGAWMRDEADRRIGHLYPRATLPDGSSVPSIAWLWARTVRCPNPACRATMPLLSSLWLSKKKGRSIWLRPVVSGSVVTFDIAKDSSGPPAPPKQGRGARFACLVCEEVTSDQYVKAEGVAGRMGAQLLAIVGDGNRQRIYLRANIEQAAAADVPRPPDVPETEMPNNPRWFSPPAFGMKTFADVFTNRQLVALTTFSDLIGEAHVRITEDATRAGMPNPDARRYADGVATYLAFATSGLSNLNSALASWRPQSEAGRSTFARQALPMVWDFVEVNPIHDKWTPGCERVAAVLAALPSPRSGTARQVSATDAAMPNVVVSTDPPYYDNIGYADLSDFFYVWLRRALRHQYPDLLGTIATPKTEELVATPYRFGGSRAKAEEHFERGLVRTFAEIGKVHPSDVPITVYYSFKQAETDDEGTASTGWETMLTGLIEADLAITATWPIRTEATNRMVASGTNTLDSSIVLACRIRPSDAQATTRRGFIQALQAELPRALRELQQGSIAPVDLAQAAIGPGMALFTRYRTVLEASGAAMTVRTALALINQILDEVLSEQEGDFDVETRFCVKWFTQFGWGASDAANADKLSRATNTSVTILERSGMFRARAGRARLVAPNELPGDWRPSGDEPVSVWEVVMRLAKALSDDGIDAAAMLMSLAAQRADIDAAKELAYLLYSVATKSGLSDSALLFNGLGTSWSDLSRVARGAHARSAPGDQSALNFDAEEGQHGN